MVEIAKALAWPVALIIGALVVFGISRDGRVRSLSASKEGGLKLDLGPLEARGTTEYNMNRRIEEIDEAITARAREEVRKLRKPIQRAVAGGSGLCASALRAVATELRGVMYGAVDENDLKHRLSVRNREGYVEGKLEQMEEDYGDIADDSGDCASADPAAYPAWPAIEEPLREALASWADRVAAIVADACREKIRVYEEYRPQFASQKDQSYVAIVDTCIEKNRGYIAGLEGEGAA